MSLGCGRYSVHIWPRGGSTIRGQTFMALEVESGEWSRIIDDTSKASVTLPSSCCDRLAGIEPRRHELHILRTTDTSPPEIVWLGPIVRMEFDGNDGVTIEAEDLSSWLTVRFVHSDLNWTSPDGLGPYRLISQALDIIADAMAPDPSPGLVPIDTTPFAATIGERKILASEHREAIAPFDELARDAIDWTAHATVAQPRAILIGEPRIYAGAPPVATIRLDHLASAPRVERLDPSTRVLVSGAGGGSAGDVVLGDASDPAAIATYGLAERRFDEPRIEDDPSAQSAAEYRLGILHLPAVRIQKAEFAPTAPVEIADLYAGARLELAFDGCPAVYSTVELTRLDVSFSGSGESIAAALTSMDGTSD